MAIAFAQLCPGRPGMFAGYRSVIVGTFQEMSPMSSDPPPVFVSAGPLHLDRGLRDQSRLARSQFLLQRAGERLIIVAPLRQADSSDVGKRRFSNSLVEMLGPR